MRRRCRGGVGEIRKSRIIMFSCASIAVVSIDHSDVCIPLIEGISCHYFVSAELYTVLTHGVSLLTIQVHLLDARSARVINTRVPQH